MDGGVTCSSLNRTTMSSLKVELPVENMGRVQPFAVATCSPWYSGAHICIGPGPQGLHLPPQQRPAPWLWSAFFPATVSQTR
jgi:hypothetical protein